MTVALAAIINALLRRLVLFGKLFGRLTTFLLLVSAFFCHISSDHDAQRVTAWYTKQNRRQTVTEPSSHLPAPFVDPHDFWRAPLSFHIPLQETITAVFPTCDAPPRPWRGYQDFSVIRPLHVCSGYYAMYRQYLQLVCRSQGHSIEDCPSYKASYIQGDK